MRTDITLNRDELMDIGSLKRDIDDLKSLIADLEITKKNSKRDIGFEKVIDKLQRQIEFKSKLVILLIRPGEPLSKLYNTYAYEDNSEVDDIREIEFDPNHDYCKSVKEFITMIENFYDYVIHL